MAILDVLGPVAALGRSLLGASAAADVVGITGPGFASMFSEARPLTASVYETADIMEHPLETGSVIADHIVFQPVEIELPLLCVGELAYRSVYASIKSSYQTGALLTVTTRTGSYDSMVITEMPHDETPDEMDAVAINLRLRRAVFVTPASAALPETSTADKGTQQTTATSASDSTSAANQYDNSGAGDKPTGSKLYQWTYGQ